MHAACWNGVRCYNRCLVSSPCQAGGQRQFDDAPDVRRAEVEPLVVHEGGGRSPRARGRNRKRSALEEKYEDTQTIKDNLLLTKDPYKNFMLNSQGQ